jgi:hypothetical protein
MGGLRGVKEREKPKEAWDSAWAAAGKRVGWGVDNWWAGWGGQAGRSLSEIKRVREGERVRGGARKREVKRGVGLGVSGCGEERGVGRERRWGGEAGEQRVTKA